MPFAERDSDLDPTGAAAHLQSVHEDRGVPGRVKAGSGHREMKSGPWVRWVNLQFLFRKPRHPDFSFRLSGRPPPRRGHAAACPPDRSLAVCGARWHPERSRARAEYALSVQTPSCGRDDARLGGIQRARGFGATAVEVDAKMRATSDDCEHGGQQNAVPHQRPRGARPARGAPGHGPR